VPVDEACCAGFEVPEGVDAHGGFGTWAWHTTIASAKKAIGRMIEIWDGFGVS
jgi:hypothetical protein